MTNLIRGEALQELAKLPDDSVYLIATDLPYGTTACSWDSVIPFEPMWEQVKRVLVPNGTFLTTCSQPFTTALNASNLGMYKYEWIWQKSKATGFIHAKNKPMKLHENVSVFSKGTTVHEGQSKNRMTYNPQGLEELDEPVQQANSTSNTGNAARPSHRTTTRLVTGYPTSVLHFPSVGNNCSVHPTQKPVKLFEYLIRTYSNTGELVLDFCMGSGTTGVAAVLSGRRFLGVEMDEVHFENAVARMQSTEGAPMMISNPRPGDDQQRLFQ